MSNPSGATIADGTATGTITNDDVLTPQPGAASATYQTTEWGQGFIGSACN